MKHSEIVSEYELQAGKLRLNNGGYFHDVLFVEIRPDKLVFLDDELLIHEIPHSQVKWFKKVMFSKKELIKREVNNILPFPKAPPGFEEE